MRRLALLIAAVGLALPVPGMADTLTLTAGPAAALPLPGNGMSMNDVLRRYGAPLRRLPPVGRPPISRWVYDRYTVYFEHDLTLTAVVHRQ